MHQKTSEILKKELDQLFNHQNINDLCLSTGFNELDMYLGGFGLEPGTITVIGARPSMGKTSFILNLLIHQLTAIGQDESILYLNAREGKTNLIQRLLAISSKVNIKAIQQRQLNEEDKAKILENGLLNVLNQEQLVLEHAASFKLTEVEALIQKTNSDKKLRLLIIDTIQSIDAEKSKDIEEGYYFIMQKLQAISIAHNIPVLISSDIHRRVEWAKEGRVPNMEDLLGSAHIGHMSDNCLMLVRPEYYQVPGEYFEMKPAEAHLILRKSKSGYPLNVVKLETDLKKQLFLNPTIYQSELI